MDDSRRPRWLGQRPRVLWQLDLLEMLVRQAARSKTTAIPPIGELGYVTPGCARCRSAGSLLPDYGSYGSECVPGQGNSMWWVTRLPRRRTPTASSSHGLCGNWAITWK
jgi:hypothetical protein